MLPRMRAWLAPPVFADEEKTLTARLLNTILLAVAGGVALYGLLAPIQPEQIPVRVAYLSAVLALVGGLMVLLRRGRVQWAARIIVIGLWCILTLVIITGGLHSPAFGGYVVVILIAGLLLGPWAGARWAVTSIIASGLILFAHQAQWLPAPAEMPKSEAIWVAGMAYFLVSVLILGLALQNFQLALRRARQEVVERQHAEAALRQQNTYLAALHDTALSLLNRREVAPLLESIVSRAAELMDTAHGYIDLVASDETALIATYATGVYTQFLGDAISRGEGVTGQAWATCQPFVVQDYQQWPQRIEAYARGGFHAIMAVPLLSQQRVMGVLGVGYLEPGKSFTPAQIEALQRFAALASIALDNARLNQAAQAELAERQRAEAAQRQAEEKYRSLIEELPVITYIDAVDKDGITTYISPQVKTILGLVPEDWIKGQLPFWLKHIHPEDRAGTLAAFYRLVDTGEAQDVEYRVQTPDGRLVWIHDRAVLLRDAEGQPLSIQGVMLDITARKHAEEALRRSEERFRMVLDNLGEGVVVQNSEWRYTFANPVAHAILGWPPGALVGAHENEILAPSGQAVVKQQNELRVQGHMSSYEVDILRPSGEIRTVFSNAVPRFDEAGNLVETFVAFTDITERKRTEEEIRRLNATLEQRVQERTAQLEAANQELESFSYSISHDLRAPLRAMDGFSRVLMDDYSAHFDDTALRYLTYIRDGAQRMSALIDDLLRFSRLGRQALRLQRLDSAALREVIQSVMRELEAENAGRVVHLTVGELPPCRADLALLRQVFANLLGNALKYTRPRAEARLEVGSASSLRGPAYFVRDNGVGFDMRYAEKLFKVFQRLHRADEFEGTGVGLAIVQRVVQKHGGQVWAEAKPGEGATFYFTLP